MITRCGVLSNIKLKDSDGYLFECRNLTFDLTPSHGDRKGQAERCQTKNDIGDNHINGHSLPPKRIYNVEVSSRKRKVANRSLACSNAMRCRNSAKYTSVNAAMEKSSVWIIFGASAIPSLETTWG